MNNRSFILLCEIVRNVHLLKPHGMIPYMMHKMYGYDAAVTTYDYGEELAYLDKEVKGLKVNFLKKIFSYKDKLPLWIYLLKNAKDIDVLMVYNIKKRPIYSGLLYKFLNPNGFLYAKADTGKDHFGFYVDTAGFPYKQYMTYLGNKFLKACDAVSVEATTTFNNLKQVPKEKLLLMPCGFDEDLLKIHNISIKPFKEKENIILHVGRMGDYDKNSELLLEASKFIENFGDWKIVFIGPKDDGFQKIEKEFFRLNPELKEKIIFTGTISDKKELFEYYNRSKIYCMTSRAESFGNALVEAQYFGNVLVGTKHIFSVQDLTKKGKMGIMFTNGDPQDLGRKLSALIADQNRLEQLSQETFTFSHENFKWQKIIPRLHKKIEEHYI